MLQDRSLEKHAGLLAGCVYDLGSGSGCYKRWCLDHAESYIAVDWPGSFHAGSVDIVADLNQKLPIADAVADSAICFSVLEHLHEPRVMLSETARILRPGGLLLLQVPWQWWVHEQPHDYFRYTPYMLRRLLLDAGFETPHIEPQGGFFVMIALKLNYFLCRLIKGPACLRWVLRKVLWFPWQLMQVSALVLDRFDWHPEYETVAYFVTARKSSFPTQAVTPGPPSPTPRENLP